MGHFKTEMKFLEEQANLQVHLYPDACDCGVLDPSEETKDEFRRVIKELLDLDENYIDYRMNLGASIQRNYRLLVLTEMLEHDMHRGTEYTVLYIKDSKLEAFSIEIASRLYTERDLQNRRDKKNKILRTP